MTLLSIVFRLLAYFAIFTGLSEAMEQNSSSTTNSLVDAMKRKEFSRFKELLSQRTKEQLNTLNNHFETPLHCAAHLGLNEQAELLLDRNADPNIRRNNRARQDFCTPLILASAYGHLSVVETLLRHGARADIETHFKSVDGEEAADTSASQALHFAADQGHADIVTALIKHGANLNAPTAEGWLPLHHAASHCHTGVVDALISDQLFPFVDARTGGLLQLPDETRVPYHQTALHLLAADASRAWRREALNGGVECRPYVDTAKLLLTGGASVNPQDARGFTPLFYAFGSRMVSLVTLLLQHNASVEIRDRNGRTPLQEAAKILSPSYSGIDYEGSLTIFKLLLASGAQPETALEDAAGWPAAMILLEDGINARNAENDEDNEGANQDEDPLAQVEAAIDGYCAHATAQLEGLEQRLEELDVAVNEQ